MPGTRSIFDAFDPVDTSSDNHFSSAIAHGPHPVAQAMASVGNLLPDSLVAMSQLGPWRFLRPAFVGDHLTADATVIGRGDAPRGSGTIVREVRIIDPDGRVSRIGEARMLVRQRAKPKESA